ncbi:hypothetical protein G3M48_009680 [Beauveria asiatica]|uniref:AAA+ ATPase domain-containing protein n=1 Tax=Beauveria asiatica TaxID=1069075 RepID=A0AAW0RIW5_9HYPO
MDEPVYDGNAHTYSSTYHNGQLMLYAHHLTAPTADGERPEYHMTQIDTWGMTAIYMNGDGRWNLATRRGQKRTNSVILPEDVKNDFFDDIAEYLDPEAVAWYVEHDLLYRRGYLLYGAPGTGKTSLSLAAAGQFGLDVYAMNLSKVNDATLNKLMSKLPTRCILLLEDIDAIEIAKSRENIDGAGSSTGSSVTLSGLLNAIDGVGSVEGRVLIMTTNHVDRLDRPGRVDKMVEFGLANREMLLELFRYIYMPLPNGTECAGDKAKGAAENQDAASIQELAVMFADRVPEMRYSPAEILSFLIPYKRSPRDAVDHIIAWVERGEGSVPLPRQTPAMSMMEEDLDVNCASASFGMELMDDSQSYLVTI